jgi:hypothetical protein
MVRDYTETSEVDPDSTVSFQEVFTRALSSSTLQGASVVDEDMDEDGSYWCVVMLSKTAAVREINQAAAEARLRVPKMASFDAERRMDEAFARVAAEEIPVVDSDR